LILRFLASCLLLVWVWSCGLSYLFVFVLCLRGKVLAGFILAYCLAVGVIGCRWYCLVGYALLMCLVFAKGFS